MKPFSPVALLIALLVSLFAGAAQALPVSVSYSVSGTSGDYTLDFTITNNMPVAQNIYFFGVLLSARDIVGSPAGGWNPNSWVTWNNTYYGDTISNYNNNWIGGYVTPGNSQSGFLVHITDAVAPSAVPWFMYLSGSEPYLGGDNLNNTSNPGFVSGAETSVDVPAPGALMLVGFGLLGLHAARRKRG
ncbi:MAG: PEP-CTERM sorting domain-containing protein [Rhodobacteraceae bacterium]|nr:PEP-CTERM sorting domain-containing protein [Paracoccaceae bacterium]